MKERKSQLKKEELSSDLLDGVNTHQASSSSAMTPSKVNKGHGVTTGSDDNTLKLVSNVPVMSVVTLVGDNVSAGDADHETANSSAVCTPESDGNSTGSSHTMRKRGHGSDVTEDAQQEDVTKKSRKDTGNGNNNNGNCNHGNKAGSPWKRITKWLKQ